MEANQEFEVGSQILSGPLVSSPFYNRPVTKGIRPWKNSSSAQIGIADSWSLFEKAPNSCAAPTLLSPHVRNAITTGQAAARSASGLWT